MKRSHILSAVLLAILLRMPASADAISAFPWEPPLAPGSDLLSLPGVLLVAVLAVTALLLLRFFRKKRNSDRSDDSDHSDRSEEDSV